MNVVFMFSSCEQCETLVMRLLVVEDDPALGPILVRGLSEDGWAVDLARGVVDARHNAPILLLTARDGLSDKVGGLDSGADDYLTKPFDFPELSARIRALTRRPPQTHQPILQHGDITLDAATKLVRRGAITVPLTAREFSLLEHMMRNPEAVHTRTELLEHVWDANYDGLSNVVDVHIANLRRKLGLPDSPAPVETIRGAGYRLADAGDVSA